MLDSKHGPMTRQSLEKNVKALRTDHKVRTVSDYVEFLRDERYKRMLGTSDNTEILVLVGELKGLQKVLDNISLKEVDPTLWESQHN